MIREDERADRRFVIVHVNSTFMSMDQLKNIFSPASPWQARLTAALASSVLLVVIVVLFLPQRFESNDDPAMMRIAAGLPTEQPSEYLVYQNVLIGLALKGLYTVAFSVPWYPLFLIGAHILALSALLFALLIRRCDSFSLLFFSFLFALFQIPILTQLSFTTTAFMAALAGFILLLSLDAGTNRRRKIFLLIAGVGMLVLAGLIHAAAVLTAGILALPLILTVAQEKRAVIWSSIGAGAILVILLTVLHQSYSARDAGWSEFRTRNRAGERLENNRLLAINDATRSHFAHVDWDENDIQLFRNSFRFDAQVFSTEKLQYLARNLPKLTVFGRSLTHVWNELWSNKWAAALAAGLIALTWGFLDRKRRGILLATAALCVGALLFGGWTAEHSFGMTHALILFSAWTAVWFICSAETKTGLRDLWRWFVNSLPATAIGIVLVILIVLQAYWEVKMAGDTSARNRYFERFVTGIIDRGPESIYISYASSVPTENMSPFFSLRRLREYQAIPGDWLTGSPVYYAALKRLQIDDVNQALLTNPNCYLIVKQELHRIAENSLRKFYERHYQRRIILPPLARVQDTQVCRILPSR